MTARSRTSGLLLAALAAIALPIAVGGQGKSAFGLAVLRRDGVMIPFAAWNGRAWSTDWPGPGASVDLPISIADVPKRWWGAPGPAVHWTAWLEDRPQPLALERPQQVPVFCGTHLGVKTDYRSSGADPRVPTVAKDGLAIAGDATLLPIVNVSVHTEDAKQIVAAITDDFNREESTAATHFVNWQHPYGDVARREYPIELEAFYRTHEKTPGGEWVTNYVEAVRRFPARPGDQGCGLITFVRGWVLVRDGGKPVIDLGARITYCDRADVSFMQPFGELIIDREPYWVYQLSSWRDEVYSVSRVRPDAVRPVMAVEGGTCPRTEANRGRGRGGGE
ncbi:MAG TPA: hypothetical protein VGI12_05005 [Vicinamibacterales bacterium]|jgi:hypothetical protein